MLHAVKAYFRRRRLRVEGIAEQLSVPTFTAGARSGVWTVSSSGLSTSSVVYSCGVGDNIAWDLAMIERFGMTVHAFDPTPASVAWIGQRRLPDRFQFHSVGIAGHDGIERFSLPKHGSRFNFHSVDLLPEPAESVKAQVRRLPTLMAQFGHDRIDILKMDVEGCEYAVVDDLLASGVRVNQLLVEFHHHFPGVGVDKTVKSVRGLQAAGFRIFHISDRGLEISFLHNRMLA